MSLDEARKILEDIEKKNAVKRNPDLENELLNYSQDMDVYEAEDYWREIEELTYTPDYEGY